LDEAWGRQKITYNPLGSSLFTSADAAFKLGFLGDTAPDIKNILDLSILNTVLQERGLPQAR